MNKYVIVNKQEFNDLVRSAQMVTAELRDPNSTPESNAEAADWLSKAISAARAGAEDVIDTPQSARAIFAVFKDDRGMMAKFDFDAAKDFEALKNFVVCELNLFNKAA